MAVSERLFRHSFSKKIVLGLKLEIWFTIL